MILPDKEIDQYLNAWSKIKIENLPISTRAMNGLLRNGVKTVADLACYTVEDLYDLPNFGKGTVKEVLDAVANEGLIIDDQRLVPPSFDLFLKMLSKCDAKMFEKGSYEMEQIKSLYKEYIKMMLQDVPEKASDSYVKHMELILDNYTKRFENIVDGKIEELTGVKKEEPKPEVKVDPIPPKEKLVSKFRAKFADIDKKYHHNETHEMNGEGHLHHRERGEF